MPEIAFLDAVAAFLAVPGRLTPAPAAIGQAEPRPGDPEPAIVLSLTEVRRLDVGLGGGLSEVSEGALPVSSEIDLTDPVLPGLDGFPLLSPDRTVLTLPHGGLIRADATDGLLGPDDLEVRLDGALVALAAAPPGAGQVSVEPPIGTLTFGTPLPAAGTIRADYHLGIWERRSTVIRGTLALDTWADAAADAVAISGAAVRAILAGAEGALSGLREIAVASLGPVEAGEPTDGPPSIFAPRRRRALLGFEYEHVEDRPVSSGGIIGTIPITARTPGTTRDPVTGADVETTATETTTVGGAG